MYVQAVKEHGAHGYAHSVSYFGADLVSPDTYRNLLFPLERDFYREVRRMGLVPIMNFWGNLTPVAELVRDSEAQGLLIDESRKGYVLDVGEIKEILGERVALFGNVSSEIHPAARQRGGRQAGGRAPRSSGPGAAGASSPVADRPSVSARRRKTWRRSSRPHGTTAGPDEPARTTDSLRRCLDLAALPRYPGPHVQDRGHSRRRHRAGGGAGRPQSADEGGGEVQDPVPVHRVRLRRHPLPAHRRDAARRRRGGAARLSTPSTSAPSGTRT